MEYLVIFICVLILFAIVQKLTRPKSEKTSPPASSELVPCVVSKLIKVTKNNPDGANRQDIIRSFCQPGARLILEPKPADWSESNIDVYIAPPEMNGELIQIGCVNEKLAKELAPHLKNGKTAKFSIDRVTGGQEGKFFGVNMIIEPPDD